MPLQLRAPTSSLTTKRKAGATRELASADHYKWAPHVECGTILAEARCAQPPIKVRAARTRSRRSGARRRRSKSAHHRRGMFIKTKRFTSPPSGRGPRAWRRGSRARPSPRRRCRTPSPGPCSSPGERRRGDDRGRKRVRIPNFKGSSLGRFPLVLADFWTSDHLSGRSRSLDAFVGTRARGTLTLKRR